MAMRKFLIAVAGAVALATSALAADMAPAPRAYTKAPAPVVAVYNWTGFYIGGSVGGHQSRDNDRAVFGVDNYFGQPTDENNAAAAWPFSRNGSGFAGGVQA